MSNKPKTALVLLFNGVEEMEVVTPIDLLRRSGVEVTVASLEAEKSVTGRDHIVIAADTTIAAVDPVRPDILVIPGGPGVAAVRSAGVAAKLARDQSNAGRWVAAICAAPTILNDAGLLENRRYTAHFSVKKELSDMVENEAVIRDGHIITSRGAGTAIPFALEIIRVLLSDEKAREIAASICYPN